MGGNTLFRKIGPSLLGLLWLSTVAQSARTAPPPELIRLDNPARGAIVNHDVLLSLDPPAHKVRVMDRLTVVHDEGVPSSEPFPVLLRKGLKMEAVLGGALTFYFEIPERMDPHAFWRRPPYEQIPSYEGAQQVDIHLNTGAEWPKTVEFKMIYSGEIYDSLHAPQSAYARSFETTDGLISEKGVYLAGSSFWVPTRPDEAFTFRCQADLPGDWRSVSQGDLLNSRMRDDPDAGERRNEVWECPQPMEEIYLVAGPWILHQRDHAGVKMQTFTYANTDSVLYNRYLDGTGRYLDLYGKLIGPYPFGKFALVENFWQTGFGMPSFTLLGDRVIRLPFILDTSYGHEILHNWWGNGVFVDADSGNWCEGLTTYGADYLYKVKESPEAARQYRLTALSGYLDYVSGNEDFPLADFRERHDFATQAIGYSKSMMVIHQLYRQVGEERFWRSLRDFYKRELWHRASWRDLLESFHTVAGVKPEPFLHQWIERAGAPRIGLSEVSLSPGTGAAGVQAAAASGGERTGAWTVRATLSQSLPDGSRNGEPFSVVIPVRLQWEAGGDSTWQVPLNTWEVAWSATVQRKPARLEVDPDYEMMRRIDRGEIPPALSRTLGADTVTVVIASGLSPSLEAAYRNLAAEWGKGQALAVVMEADQPKGWEPRTSAWYLGNGPAAEHLVGTLPEVSRGDSKSWRIAGDEYPAGSGVVLAGSFAGSEGNAWSLIAAPDSASASAIGGKVPHYGRYSFLVFDGAKNIGEGIWRQTASPLVADLAAASGGTAVPGRSGSSDPAGRGGR